MNTNIRRAFALIFVFLLVFSAFCFSTHALFSHSGHLLPEGEVDCVICAIVQGLRFILPTAVILSLIILTNLKINKESVYTPIKKPLQIPLLC